MATATRAGRLRRSDCSGTGLRRVRRGRGFSYIDEQGRRSSRRGARSTARAGDPPGLAGRLDLPDPLGHLQATGVDAAGRKQYLYHPHWREHRDREKFDGMVDFARALPELRERRRRATWRRRADPGAGAGLRGPAAGPRLLPRRQRGATRRRERDSGSRRCARSTCRADGAVSFDYLGQGRQRRRQAVADPLAATIVARAQAAPGRRRGAARLPRRPALARRPLRARSTST